MFDGERKKPFVGTKIDMFEYVVLSDVYAHNDKCEEGGVYYSRLSEVLTSKYIDVDRLFSLGIDIGSQICTEFRSTKTRLTAYLNTMEAILRVHFDVNGESPTQKSYMGLRYYIALAIVNELARTEATEKMFSLIKKTLEIDTEDEQLNENNRKHISNLETLEGEFDAYRKMADIANRYREHELDDDTLQNLQQKATLLTQEAMRHRKYGTKPAYIDASIGGAWIFYDADDWRKKISNGGKDDNKELFSNIAAIVCYSPYDEFKTLNFRSTYDRFGDRIVEAGDTLDKIDLTLFIDKSGDISMDVDGVTDLGLELNISPSQELALRAEVASNFYDLSMPVVKNRPEEKTFENVIDRKRANFNPIQDLLIPRIKYLEQPEDFLASDDIIRTIRKHDVTWFVRVLPNGWHASPEALIEAEAHGIELADNETFVKAHSRGHGDRIVGHHAIRRAVKEQKD